MTYQVKFNDITPMQSQTNQTIQQRGLELDGLQESIALLANNSELHGKAAEWGDMLGGAEQIVTPFRGDVMLDLGMMEEF